MVRPAVFFTSNHFRRYIRGFALQSEVGWGLLLVEVACSLGLLEHVGFECCDAPRASKGGSYLQEAIMYSYVDSRLLVWGTLREA